MSKIVGYIIETDEVHKGELTTKADILKPNGDFHFVLFSNQMHDERRLATYQHSYLKLVFAKSWIDKLRASLKGAFTIK